MRLIVLLIVLFPFMSYGADVTSDLLDHLVPAQPEDFGTLIAYLMAGGVKMWVGVGVCINALLQLLKSSIFDVKLGFDKHPQRKTQLALVLGILIGGSVGFANGWSWYQLLGEGIATGMAAIGMHEMRTKGLGPFGTIKGILQVTKILRGNNGN